MTGRPHWAIAVRTSGGKGRGSTQLADDDSVGAPPEFNTAETSNAGQVQLDRCSVNAGNIWFVATGARQAGPIGLLNCTFLGNSRAESHQRWSTGMLYDGCRALEGGIEFRNRGSMGSGHGWSMGCRP